MWWNSEEGILYIYYDDGDTQQWVQAAGSAGGGEQGANVSISLQPVTHRVIFGLTLTMDVYSSIILVMFGLMLALLVNSMVELSKTR